MIGRAQPPLFTKAALSRAHPSRKNKIIAAVRRGHQVARFAPLVGVFRLPRDHSVRFSDSAAFVAGSFQGFVGDFRPELFQRRRCGLVRVPFGIIRSPRRLMRFP